MLPQIYEKKETLLKVENVSKKYGNKTIIRDINLEIKNIVRPDMHQGQVVSLIGRSGIGKSTLFRTLAGLEIPTTGTVQVFCEKNGLKPVREGDMGVVFQNYIMFDHRTVRQNFELSISHRLDKIDAKQYIDVYANEFSLQDHLDKYPCQLSGGQRQRSAIIMQLLNGSNFLLLDEPLSGLDAIMIDKLTNVLTRIAQSDEHLTLVIISHDLENSLAISDTAFILSVEDGKEGAFLKSEIDLIERGLAWRPDIKDLPLFRETLKEVKALL